MRKTRCVECGKPIEHDAKALLLHSDKCHHKVKQVQDQQEEQVD
jgi:DNA-directed RNA polymerase subunit RPC12/RpoP